MTEVGWIILFIIFGFVLCINIFTILLWRKIIINNDMSLSFIEKIIIKIVGVFGGEKLKKNRENYFENPEYRRKYAYINLFSGVITLIAVVYILFRIYIKTY